MNQLRYSFLLTMIRDLEDHTEIAGTLLSELSKSGRVDHSLASSNVLTQLDARLAACNRLTRQIALKVPELLEVTYE
jgi:hypothetical protein